MDDDKNVQIVSWIRRTVRIYTVGSNARQGRLLAVKPDYLVLHHDKQRITYYPLHYIHSIAIDSMETPELMKSQGTAQTVFFDRDSFDDVFQCMKNQWIQVHNGGTVEIQGVLSDNLPDHILLVSQSEIIRVFKSHIQLVSCVLEDAVYPHRKNQSSDEHKKIAAEPFVNEQIKQIPEAESALVNEPNTKRISDVSDAAMACENRHEQLKPPFRRRSQHRMRFKKRCARMKNKAVKVQSYEGSKNIGLTKTIRGANKTFGMVKNKVTTLWFPKCNKVWNAV